MQLNHYDHPYKAAAMDVLTADDVRFSNGESFIPMDSHTAQEIVELISSEGHGAFVNQLLNKTADLLDKSDNYLKDVEKDIHGLAPTPVEVEDTSTIEDRVSSVMQRRASEGNFDRSPSGGMAPPTDNMQSAFGATKVARNLAALKKLKG
jgi:hypothetical protein